MKTVIPYLAAIAFVVGSAQVASANYGSTTGTDYAVIGMIGTQATICMSTGGTETATSLGTGGLSASGSVDMLGGIDTVIMVRTSGYNPGSTHDCGSSSWNPLTYSGHFFDVFGSAGTDNLQGGLGDTYVHGGDDADYVYGYSTIGQIFGDAGNDQVLSVSSGGSDALFGGTENDCLTDQTNSVVSAGSFDCETGSDFYTWGNSSIQTNCETGTECCGIC